MDRTTYLKYIAHYVEHVDQRSSRLAYKKFFASQLGKDMFMATDVKIKNCARHLYKSYVLGSIIKFSPLGLATVLSSDQLSSFIEDEIALYNKYGLIHPID